MVRQRTDTWYVTYGLIAVNVVVFIVGVALGDSIDGSLVVDRRGNFDGLVSEASTWGPAIDFLGEWWRVFTGGFLHHGAFHLAVNMFSLYILGLAVERSVGRISFSAVYFSSLVGGSFGALIESPNAAIAGASGAIFGLMGAYAAISLVQGIGLFQTPIGPILAINLVISFTVRSVSLGGHVGGLIGGFLVGAAAAQALRRQQHTIAFPLTTAFAVAALSFAGSLWAASRWVETL